MRADYDFLLSTIYFYQWFLLSIYYHQRVCARVCVCMRMCRGEWELKMDTEKTLQKLCQPKWYEI